MQVRTPNFHFERALPHWAPNREFAHANNAGSTTLPVLEPYLNRVMRKAREQLPSGSTALIADIDLFVRQEANHYQQHQRYNDCLYRAGYGGLREFEAELKTDYQHFLAARPLKFNVAYAEGFESLGIIYAKFFFERVDDLLEGSDENVAHLWKWHFAEEFEHRTVCHDVYHELFGGYWYRVYGLFYAIWHLGRYGKRATAYLLKTDRENMTMRARLQSRCRAFRYQSRLSLFMFPHVLRILSPAYDPRGRRPPRGAEQFLSSLETI